MDPVIRAARPEDREAIAGFTQETFEWGDYVLEAFARWLDGSGSRVLVAEVGGQVVGMARGAMLSESEAWLQGARIHPGHRRHGIGGALNDALCAWAAHQGAVVTRLAVEDWNEPARRQVLGLGFRPVGTWIAAERALERVPPKPRGNGGTRVPGPERLRPAHRGEVEPAYLAWARGELAVAGRELVPRGWTWRRLVIDDLVEAASQRQLWEARSGWAIASMDEDTFGVTWLAVIPDDVSDLLGAIVDRAMEEGADSVELKVPDLEWTRGAVEEAGFDLRPLTLFAKPVG